MYPTGSSSAAAARRSAERCGSSAVSPFWRGGAAAVEFALVVPIVLLLLLASIEFGRMLMVSHGLEAAAREGCRTAISWDASSRDVEDVVEERLATFGISDYVLTIDPDPPTDARQWEPVTVRIAVGYDALRWLPRMGFLQGVTLTGECTLPQESDPEDL